MLKAFYLVVPVCMKINVTIVNVDTSDKECLDGKKFESIPYPSYFKDFLHSIKNSDLNRHKKELFIIQKDGHYDILYKNTTK